MLTKLTVRNFKRFESAQVDLGKAVVFIGPNNSGKTTALQALALWDIGKRSWLAKRGGKASPDKRPGVAINRKDLITIPVPTAKLLWHQLHTRNAERVSGKTRTKNVRIDVVVEGITNDNAWECGFEFDYSGEEAFLCRPIRLQGQNETQVRSTKFSEIPPQAIDLQISYLPPMSGLTDREHVKQPGEIGFLIGQGRTAEVLRNLCYQVYQRNDSAWLEIVGRISKLFGVKLRAPEYISELSEIRMEYEEKSKTTLDLSSAGRGLQQSLLLLSHLYANPKSILLLDEPDAHLEIIRQRQTYQLLTEVAEKQGSQIISASHSEVVLNEAAGRGKVIAFVGQPHTMNDRPSQVMKSLSDIGWDQYYQAEETGWLLCLEGSTDLSILRAFAQTLKHEALAHLERPFVHYVSTNLPQRARDLFYGLKEAKADLVGIAIFDRLDSSLQKNAAFTETMWNRRELENYFCTEDVLMTYAKGEPTDDLFGNAEREKRELAMRESIDEIVTALRILDRPDPWGPDIKATTDFLDPLFKKYFQKLALPITFRKTDYHELARLVPKDQIDNEIGLKLDSLVSVAKKAKPRK